MAYYLDCVIGKASAMSYSNRGAIYPVAVVSRANARSAATGQTHMVVRSAASARSSATGRLTSMLAQRGVAAAKSTVYVYRASPLRSQANGLSRATGKLTAAGLVSRAAASSRETAAKIWPVGTTSRATAKSSSPMVWSKPLRSQANGLSRASGQRTSMFASRGRAQALSTARGLAHGVVLSQGLASAKSSAAGGRLTAMGVVVSRADAKGWAEEFLLGEVWVTNTHTGAVSYWTGLSGKSTTVWQGKVVLAGPDGVYALTAAPVSGVLDTGWADYGSVQMKRMDMLYAEVDTTGTVTCTVSAGDMGSRTGTGQYTLTPTVHGPHRTAVGRGLIGRYWKTRFAVSGVGVFRGVATDVSESKRRI